MINQVLAGMMFKGGPQAYSGASSQKTMTQKMSQVADRVDKNNTGNVTKEQFVAAFQSLPMPIKIREIGAEALFDKVDKEKKGSVSRQDFAIRMKDVIFQNRSQGTAQSSSTPSQNPNTASNANASSATAKAQNPSYTIASSTKSLEATAGRQAAASPSYAQSTGSNVNVYA